MEMASEPEFGTHQRNPVSHALYRVRGFVLMALITFAKFSNHTDRPYCHHCNSRHSLDHVEIRDIVTPNKTIRRAKTSWSVNSLKKSWAYRIPWPDTISSQPPSLGTQTIMSCKRALECELYWALKFSWFMQQFYCFDVCVNLVGGLS